MSWAVRTQVPARQVAPGSLVAMQVDMVALRLLSARRAAECSSTSDLSLAPSLVLLDQAR